MKSIKFLSTLLIIILTTTMSFSQNIKTKIPGINSTISVTTKDVVNIVKSFNLDVKIPKTKEQLLLKSVPTESKATYKDVEYPVYSTDKGKLFIILPNKENTGYKRKYIPKELYSTNI